MCNDRFQHNSSDAQSMLQVNSFAHGLRAFVNETLVGKHLYSSVCPILSNILTFTHFKKHNTFNIMNGRECRALT